ncbi:hypothetical protein [Ensifer sp. ENS03]|uniref:hypothetical protein n=1 Tax=Ensifer TaxID=106591 RepID=UPI0017808DBF|nr:hypothetical protein [Ensifer sp. ENS03]MBD9559270.1 hypothetical protein [Ensifer sp. ENS03]
MFRVIAAALAAITISCCPGSPFAAPTNAVSGEQTLTPADLVPSPVFKLGMPIEELETLLARDFKDWERSETTRSLNNRKDPKLPAYAKAPYLQRIHITRLDQQQGFRRTYSLTLNSPLSGSRLYSVVYNVEALRPFNDLGSLSAVAQYLSAMWGSAHSGSHKGEFARLSYLFDRQGELVRDGDASCAPLYPALVRLDEKTPDEVERVIAMIDATNCGGNKSVHFRLQADGDTIVETTFFNTILAVNPRDVLKRVRYGQP